MNIMIFASTPISHIIPLRPLIKELKSKNNKVYIVSSVERQKLIESMGCIFINYPFNFEESALKLKTSDKMYELEYLWKKNRYLEAMEEYLKFDLRKVNQATEETLSSIEKIVIDNNIDLIFRDSVEKHAYIIAKKLNIKCIGYITHNLYSNTFFEKNPEYYYRIFLNCKNFNEIDDNFFAGFRKYITKLTYQEKVANTNETMKVFHQFDPDEDYNLIFSSNLIQPEDYCRKKYDVIYPERSAFDIETNIPKSLLKFVSEAKDLNKKIVYIATGSIMSTNIDYYINFARFFIHNGMKVIISLPHKIEKAIKLINECNLEKDIYIDTFVPQKYVLDNSSLFLSSGGQNSILESMYFKVPTLITPMTSEQRINGIVLEEKNLSRTTYDIKKEHKTIGSMIYELLHSKEIQQEISKVSYDLKNHKNDFSKMWSYINENN